MNNKKSILLYLLTFFLFSGCEKLEIGEPFDCIIGTQYRVNRNLSFTIDSIYDYRCPADMECLWSGDVDLYFDIKQHSEHTDTLIYLWTGNRNPFRAGEYTLKILEVNPLRKSDETIDQADYKIRMTISKN